MAKSGKIISFVLALLTILTTCSYGQSSDLGTVCAESRHLYGVEGFEGSSFAWALESGGIIVQGDGTDTILVEWGYNTGQYLMEVVELSASGCLGVPVMANTTIQAPEVDLGFDFYEICDGDSLVLDASGDYDGIPSYLWHDGSSNFYYVADSTQLVWVLVTDGLGCTREDSVDFVKYELPVVYLGRDTMYCNSELPLELDAGDFSAYEWETNTDQYIGNPIYIDQRDYYTDTVKVLVTDENGCQSSDTMLIFPCSLATMFDEMRNTFTPNDDTQNDKWVIIDHMDQFPHAVLEIFDRWGRLIYRSENIYYEPWDGRVNGKEAPMDAYFFVLELNYPGFNEAITGTVNLIR